MDQRNLSKMSFVANDITKNTLMSARKFDSEKDCDESKAIINATDFSFYENISNKIYYNLDNVSHTIVHDSSSTMKNEIDRNLKTGYGKENVEIEHKKRKLDVIIKKGNIVLQQSASFQKSLKYTNENLEKRILKDMSNQHVDIAANDNHSKMEELNETTRSISCQTLKVPILSIANIRDNEKAIEYYTGLQNYEKFLYVFKTLGSDVHDLLYYYCDQKLNLEILDQFLLTLILLRQQKSHYEISILFDVTLKEIKNIFITWIRFMKLEWANIELPQSYKPDLQSIITDNVNELNSRTNSITEFFRDIEVIDLENDEGNSDECQHFKKVYKILNGPQNYIETYLMIDVVFVCHILCYFKARRIIKNEN